MEVGDKDFFSEDVPFNKFTKEKILKGKYSYNLAGFGNKKFNTSIDKNKKRESDLEFKFVKNARKNQEFLEATFDFGSKYKHAGQLNQTMSTGEPVTRHASLVQSSYDFQDYPTQNARKNPHSANSLLMDPMKTKLIAMRTNPPQKVYNQNLRPRKLQKQLSVYNLNYPKEAPKEELSQMAQIAKNLKNRKMSSKEADSLQKPRLFKKSESTQNLMFVNYKPFQLKSTTVESVEQSRQPREAHLKQPLPIKKSNQDKKLKSQYTVADNQATQNVFYTNKYPTTLPTKNKHWRMHSKSMSIHGNLFGASGQQSSLQKTISESGSPGASNWQASRRPPRT